MARVLKPVAVPSAVQIAVEGQTLRVKGGKGELVHQIHADVEAIQEEGTMRFAPRGEKSSAMPLVGTTRALFCNMLQGVNDGFERKLELVGVGYRAQAKGDVLNLTLGFSHPVNYAVPTGISIETPSQTEVVVRGIDKQKVGQVAAEIRAFRPPEPYKGKGVKYAGERIIRKEAKKK